MRNPTGKNGHGPKNYPPDETLKASLMEYVLKGLTQKEKVIRLAADHNLSIGTTSLNILERRLEIPSVRRTPTSQETVRQHVIDQLSKDIVNANGPRFVKESLQVDGVMATRCVDQQRLSIVQTLMAGTYQTRDNVRTIMLEEQPEGFSTRFPGHRKTKIPRKPLSAIGPLFEVSADGHEKLGSQALKFGNDVGISIYSYKDKWTDVVLKLCAVRDCRSPGVIGHLYLDLIDELGGARVDRDMRHLGF
ncbi:hypothetical protein HGRIS_004186 [Hohenbuehelia grisea]|uniref:Transposase n=1 Tax=Hohenbuehelia grisea TaxID=104357 RepID=A0ABR3JIE7_9AGAR